VNEKVKNISNGRKSVSSGCEEEDGILKLVKTRHMIQIVKKARLVKLNIDSDFKKLTTCKITLCVQICLSLQSHLTFRIIFHSHTYNKTECYGPGVNAPDSHLVGVTGLNLGLEISYAACGVCQDALN
jgi:hypothetical protein